MPYVLEDLIKGDENNGIMHTGDIARRDVDGAIISLAV